MFDYQYWVVPIHLGAHWTMMASYTFIHLFVISMLHSRNHATGN